jgi:CheY-like chemotaxis protein
MCRSENGPEAIDSLAVDDEQVNLLLLSGRLRREGFYVVCGLSGY